MDVDNMIFSTGSAFIFGSWIYEVGDDGKLQSRLLKDSDHHEDVFVSATMTDQVTGRFMQLVMSDSTQVSQLCASDSNSGSASKMEYDPSSFENPSSFPMRLQNVASAYQEYNSECTQNLSKKSDLFSFRLHMARTYQAQLER